MGWRIRVVEGLVQQVYIPSNVGGCGAYAKCSVQGLCGLEEGQGGPVIPSTLYHLGSHLRQQGVLGGVG
jgi:hypothetical protein